MDLNIFGLGTDQYSTSYLNGEEEEMMAAPHKFKELIMIRMNL